MEPQPSPIRASSLAAEMCVSIMRSAEADPDLQVSAAHVALWLQDGPQDTVARISEETVLRIQLQLEAGHD